MNHDSPKTAGQGAKRGAARMKKNLAYPTLEFIFPIVRAACRARGIGCPETIPPANPKSWGEKPGLAMTGLAMRVYTPLSYPELSRAMKHATPSTSHYHCALISRLINSDHNVAAAWADVKRAIERAGHKRIKGQWPEPEHAG